MHVCIILGAYSRPYPIRPWYSATRHSCSPHHTHYQHKKNKARDGATPVNEGPLATELARLYRSYAVRFACCRWRWWNRSSQRGRAYMHPMADRPPLTTNPTPPTHTTTIGVRQQGIRGVASGAGALLLPARGADPRAGRAVAGAGECKRLRLCGYVCVVVPGVVCVDVFWGWVGGACPSLDPLNAASKHPHPPTNQSHTPHTHIQIPRPPPSSSSATCTRPRTRRTSASSPFCSTRRGACWARWCVCVCMFICVCIKCRSPPSI